MRISYPYQDICAHNRPVNELITSVMDITDLFSWVLWFLTWIAKYRTRFDKYLSISNLCLGLDCANTVVALATQECQAINMGFDNVQKKVVIHFKIIHNTSMCYICCITAYKFCFTYKYSESFLNSKTPCTINAGFQQLNIRPVFHNKPVLAVVRAGQVQVISSHVK